MTVDSERHLVAVLVRDGLLPLELGIPHQIFGRARSSRGAPYYEVMTCSATSDTVRTSADFTIRVEHGPELLSRAATVVVPAATEDYDPATAGRNSPAMAAALARLGPRTRIASICTGAFVLAAAGLLDGLRATTHWQSAELFRHLFPTVDLDPGVLYVDEGDVLTSAGEAAGIDLCLHMVRRDHGAAVAADVARATVVPPHREGGQAQYIRKPVAHGGSSATATARAWALDHLDQRVTLSNLAARELTSVRTLTRHFRDEVGMTPLQWLTRQRVDRACELLEQTDLPIERVAASSGFGTAASLRQQLRCALGVSPSAYRTTFRGPAG